MAAAVADFRPGRAAPTARSPRSERERFALELVRTADVLAEARADAARQGQIVIGFAAEHGPAGVERAREQAGAQAAWTRSSSTTSRDPEIGFDSIENEVTIVDRSGERRDRTTRSKDEVAAALLDFVQELRRRGHQSVGRERRMSEAGFAPRPGSERRLRALPARPRAARRQPLGAGGGLAREGEAPRAGQDLDPGGTRAGVFPQRPVPRRGREFSAVVERYPANDYAHFCLGRSLEKLGDRARRAAATCRWPAACARTAPTTACTAIACAPLELGARSRRTSSARVRDRHPCDLGAMSERRPRRGESRRSGWVGAARRRRRTARAQAEASPRRSRALRVFDDERGAHGPLAARPRRAAAAVRQPVHALRRLRAGPAAELHRGGRARDGPSGCTSTSAASCSRAGGARSRRGVSAPGCRSSLTNEGPVTLLVEIAGEREPAGDRCSRSRLRSLYLRLPNTSGDLRLSSRVFRRVGLRPLFQF